nr:unnamed protein product [Callosobruchus analis]
MASLEFVRCKDPAADIRLIHYNHRFDVAYTLNSSGASANVDKKRVSSVARNRNWCRDQDRENCTSELPVADLQHHPKTTPTEEEATVRRLYVRPPVEHLRII